MIIHSQNSSSVTCPFCNSQQELHLGDMLLYFEEESFFIDSNYKDAKGELISLLPTAFKEHNRMDGSFKKFWEAKLNANNSEETTDPQTVEGGKGIVLNPDIFVSHGTNTGWNKYTIGNYTLYYNPNKPLDTVIYLDKIGKAIPKALCCPCCECFFPTSFFDLDCYFIILAGESSVGKTMWLTALFQNGFAPLRGMCDSKKGWMLEAQFEAAYDGPSRRFQNGVRFYENKGIIPEGTPHAIPPIFLTLSWVNRKCGKKYTHNVCIIDTMGEDWGQYTSDGTPKSVVFSDLSDATIYFIQPYQGKGYSGAPDTGGFYILDDDSESQDDLEVADEPDRSDSDNSKKDKRKQDNDYFRLYSSHFVNNRKIETKPCAFVISQIDLYKTAPFKGSTSSIPYFDSVFSDCDSTGKRDMNSQRTELLNQEKLFLHNIAAFQIIRNHFPNLSMSAHAFTNSNYFAISSFTGEEKTRSFYNMKTGRFESKNAPYLIEVDCITQSQRNQAVNIHEPMIWTLINLISGNLAKTNDHSEIDQSVSKASSSRTVKKISSKEDDLFKKKIASPGIRRQEPKNIGEDETPTPGNDDNRHVLRRPKSHLYDDYFQETNQPPTSSEGVTANTDDFITHIPYSELKTKVSAADVLSGSDEPSNISEDQQQKSDAPSRRIKKANIRKNRSPESSNTKKADPEPGDDIRPAISLDDLMKDDENDNTSTIFSSFSDKQ